MSETRYVVCEAYPSYRQHIRELAVGDIPNYHGYSGDVAHTTLCGQSLKRGGGWDTRLPLPRPGHRDAWMRPTGGHPCPGCCDAYLKRIGG